MWSMYMYFHTRINHDKGEYGIFYTSFNLPYLLNNKIIKCVSPSLDTSLMTREDIIGVDILKAILYILLYSDGQRMKISSAYLERDD